MESLKKALQVFGARIPDFRGILSPKNTHKLNFIPLDVSDKLEWNLNLSPLVRVYKNSHSVVNFHIFSNAQHLQGCTPLQSQLPRDCSRVTSNKLTVAQIATSQGKFTLSGSF